MNTRAKALAGLLALAVVFGGAMYVAAQVMPEEESDSEIGDEEVQETAGSEETEDVSENETEPEEYVMHPRRGRHMGLWFIFDLDENISDEVNITELKENLRTLLEEIKEDGYFNRTRDFEDCNRTWEPRDNRTPSEYSDNRTFAEDAGRPQYMGHSRMRHQHEMSECPVEEGIEAA